MTNDPATLAALFWQFAVLSLFAIGGGGSAVPEMHRQTVEIAQSLSDRQFSELFAIAQAAPGPNIMFVALLGHFIAGAPGAAVATVAMCGPSCVLACAVSQVVELFRRARRRIPISGRFGAGDHWPCCCERPVACGAARRGLLCHHGNDVRGRLVDPALAAGGFSHVQRS